MNQFDNKLFVINKESGPTSFDVVDAFRRSTGLRKVGHSGTLDPLAEGVLLMCTGRATRAVEHFMDLYKVYEFEIRLGVETTTLDAEGDIINEAPCPELSDAEIRETAAGFVGEYRLEPPAYSALKRNGRRLYQLARAGETPPTPPVESRLVTIHEMEVLEIAVPSIFCRIKCSRGTYVRSLARDFGRRLSLPAHIGRLVRTRVGQFRVEDGYGSGRLFNRNVDGLQGVTLSEALAFLPGIVIRGESRSALLDGVLPGVGDVVNTIGAISQSTSIRILDEAGELLAIGSRDPGKERKRSIWVDSYRLFVDRGTLSR
jgi:tRNA pseudouridine55 synthase